MSDVAGVGKADTGAHATVGKRRKAMVVLLVAGVVAVAWWQYDHSQRQVAAAAPYYGTIEVEEVSLAAEVAGQVAAPLVKDGDRVAAGQPLVTLEASLLEAQLRQAEAALAVARANAAMVEAGPRAEEIAQLEAGVAQALAARDGARAAWENARAAADSPQELEAQVAVARAQLAAARARLERVRAGATEEELAGLRAAVALARARYDQGVKGATPEQLEVAERQYSIARNQEYLVQQQTEEYSRRTYGGTPAPPTLIYSKGIGDAQLGVAYEQTKLAEAQLAAMKAAPTAEQLAQLQAVVDQARAQLARAEKGPTSEDLRLVEAEVEIARAHLVSLEAIAAEPQAALAVVDAAAAQYKSADEVVRAARARLEAARAGPTPEQRAVTQAQVAQAEAALGVLRAQLERSATVAPVDGVVLRRLVNQGETVAPGARLLTLAQLDEVHLVVYVPETRLGQVSLGQRARVTVDSYPGHEFEGRVVHVAERAEYTPRNAASQRDRANSVFAVKVALANPDHQLRAGMSADARFDW